MLLINLWHGRNCFFLTLDDFCYYSTKRNNTNLTVVKDMVSKREKHNLVFVLT